MLPASVSEFLSGKRLAVAGVSRQKGQAANAIFQKLRSSGYDVVPLNPRAPEVEGVPCFAHVRDVPHALDGVVIATHPRVAAEVVRECAECGVKRVWFHRSFGTGSVSTEAVETCRERGIDPIVGGCPLMFSEPVDVAHKCMRWWLQRRGRAPR